MTSSNQAWGFQYRSLTEPDTIRTLVLGPGPKDTPVSFALEHQLFDGKLTYGMETGHINAGVPYIAVSYTWDGQPF
jgi:hypothetical protein